jgi:hypothetical protein
VVPGYPPDVSPLVDLSLVKAQLAERIQLVVQLFPQTTNLTVEVPPDLLDQAQPAEAKGLPSPELEFEADAPPPLVDKLPGVEVVVPQKIGVVKAWDFVGTRLQIEFVILNDTDHLIAVRNLLVLIGGFEIPDPQVSQYVPDTAYFKQFVDVTPEARLPSKRRRLPVVVKARSGMWLCAEVESSEDVAFGARIQDCSLHVVLGDNTIVTCPFRVYGTSLWAALISQMQEAAIQEKSAAAVGLPITPVK